ncbi:PREDICTED: vegetative cell wall protein gp1-like [Ipomoea nil]|uniref:vegetative cell wall protein gp1-like n=1 Tax=Ipomoea nil TaxID=35883 RepID=UPI00090136C4|nr:PREDICTED: vegetative cell wall protein gp1-like [Ipomoea nil]XP_019166504.1 PREDICTED: vegetative cell wall protein gp1-like [Ipomoea nil]
MMMTRTISVVLFFAMLALHRSLAEDSPTASPAPAPVTGTDDFSPPAPAPTPDSPSRAPPQDASSPPPLDLGSPSPSPADAKAYSPASDSQVAKDVRQVSTSEEKSSGRGKKVGIAVGVVAGACVAGLGALVYKKRRDNIRRSQYGQDARGSLL